jgi:hypothetical protein
MTRIPLINPTIPILASKIFIFFAGLWQPAIPAWPEGGARADEGTEDCVQALASWRFVLGSVAQKAIAGPFSSD